MELSLSHVMNVSIAESQAGIGAYNTSNIAILSHEAKNASFGSAAFKIYLDPTEVEKDFGTDSVTYAMALSIFSQKPSMRAAGGYLVIIPVVAGKILLTPSEVPDAGSIVYTYGEYTITILFSDNEAAIKAKFAAVPPLVGAVVTGSLSTTLEIETRGVYGAAVLTAGANTLTADSDPVTVVATAPVVAEKAGQTITRAKSLVQFFGILHSFIVPEADMLEEGTLVETLNKIVFQTSKTAADLEVGGRLDKLRSGSLRKSRGLFYGNSSEKLACVFSAAYASRALSVNFSGTNTTITMHMKDLVGLQPDATMTETLFQAAQNAGVDIYASFQGVPKTYTSGANKFFDRVHNAEAYLGDLIVAGFNYLAKVATKIPQTEGGMDGWKGSYRKVCEKFVTNQFLAPGEWDDATTFGDQEDFLENIRQRGYFIYSAPIGTQSSADRAARKAPLVQIAVKEAGAMHEGSVIVNINQ